MAILFFLCSLQTNGTSYMCCSVRLDSMKQTIIVILFPGGKYYHT